MTTRIMFEIFLIQPDSTASYLVISSGCGTRNGTDQSVQIRVSKAPVRSRCYFYRINKNPIRREKGGRVFGTS